MTVKVPFLSRVRHFAVENDRVESRLTARLVHLRMRKANQLEIELSAEDEVKIKRRAKFIRDLRKDYVSLRTFRNEDRTPLKNVSKGVTLKGPVTEDEVDVLGAALHDEMPWMQPVTEKIWFDMRRHVQSGGVGIKFSPTLMVGPPGIGKSHLARRLGELSQTPSVVIDVSATTEGFSVVGSQRTWGSSTPGRPVQTILEKGVGNPIVVIDEICKVGIVTSTSGARTSVLDALLGLLEPVSARNWDCPYYQTRIPEALRSRMRVVPVAALTTAHLVYFAKKMVRKRGLPDEVVEDVLRLLSAYPEMHPKRNLRTVTKHLNEIEVLSKNPHFDVRGYAQWQTGTPPIFTSITRTSFDIVLDLLLPQRKWTGRSCTECSAWKRTMTSGSSGISPLQGMLTVSAMSQSFLKPFPEESTLSEETTTTKVPLTFHGHPLGIW